MFGSHLTSSAAAHSLCAISIGTINNIHNLLKILLSMSFINFLTNNSSQSARVKSNAIGIRNGRAANLIHDVVLSQSSQMTDMCNQHIMLDALEKEQRNGKGERAKGVGKIAWYQVWIITVIYHSPSISCSGAQHWHNNTAHTHDGRERDVSILSHFP